VPRDHLRSLEAAAADLKARHPNLPWRDIAGSGNIYRHDYEDILAWRVWETARSLTELRQAIEQELAK
jgi:uncharacterized protein with HEPN domain